MKAHHAHLDEAHSHLWDRFNEKNWRDEKMSRIWVMKLIAWVRQKKLAGPEAWMLDYGCGYFDVGLGLADTVGQADGYDPFTPALALASDRTKELTNVHLYGDAARLPRQCYDLIIVNSVIQYFTGLEELRGFLQLAASLLKRPGPSWLLLSDVLPAAYPVALDAVEHLLYAARRGILYPMLKNIWYSATRPRTQKLFQVDFETILAESASLGFTSERLGENLTPSRRRYSCLLVHTA